MLILRVWRSLPNNRKSTTQSLKTLLTMNISKTWLGPRKIFISMIYYYRAIFEGMKNHINDNLFKSLRWYSYFYFLSVWKKMTLSSDTDQSRYRVWDYPIKEQYTHIFKVNMFQIKWSYYVKFSLFVPFCYILLYV